MADGKIEYDIVANTSSIRSALSGIGSIAAGVGKSVLAIGTAVGTAALAVAGYAVKVGSEFEAAMSGVAAVAGFSVEELNKVGSETQIQFRMLEEAALEAGRTTVFTATESAEALKYLQLAGYSVTESIETLPSVLNLAAAANIDLGYATNLVVDSAHALGIELDDLDGFLDQITATAFNSNTSIDDLAEAFLVLGGTGRLVAGDTAELNQILGILADNGIKGSEGGTKLRNVLLSLSAPTDKAANQLDELGVSVADAEGNLRPLEDIIGELGESLEGLGDVEATDILNKIFNKRDIVAVQALLNATEEDWTKLANAIEDSEGSTAQAAETLLDNLQGDLTLLRSQLEYTGIAIYQQFQEPLRESVGIATQFLDTITSDGTIEQFAAVLGDVATALATGLVELLPVVLNLIQELLPIISEAADNVFPLLVDAVFAIIPIFTQLVTELLPPLLELFSGLLPPLLSLIETILPPLIELFETLVPVALEIIETVLPVLIELFEKLLPPLLELVQKILPPLVDIFLALWLAVEPLIDLLVELIALIFDIIEPVIDVIALAIEPLIEIFNFLVGLIYNTLSPAFETIKNVFDTVLRTMFESAATHVKAIIDIFQGIIDFVKAVFSGDWEAAWEAVINIFKGIWDGIVNVIKTPLNIVIDLCNVFIRGINNLKIPDWVPGIGGASPNLPEIPHLKVGLDYVPYDEFPAFLHQGEAVLTAPEAELWRSMKGISAVQSDIGSSIATISSARSVVQPSGDFQYMNQLVSSLEKSLKSTFTNRKTVIEFTGDGADLVELLYPQIKEEEERIGTRI